MAKNEIKEDTRTSPVTPNQGEAEQVSSSNQSSAGSSAAYSGSDFDKILSSLLETYAPTLIQYEPANAQTLQAQIAQWLRPVYEQSIKNRENSTSISNAELDADAISRGMGSSTYVTDVKNHNFLDQSKDIANIETDYGSALAKYLFEALEDDRDRQLEVDTFNADAKNHAYEQAFDAAVALYETYKASGGGSSLSHSASGGSSLGAANAAQSTNSRADRAQDIYGSVFSSVETVDPKDSALYLALLSGDKRDRVLNGTSKSSIKARAELVKSLGAKKYQQYVKRYKK